MYKCWTKASKAEKGGPRYSHNWMFSRRAWFKIYRDRIECGDWTLPFNEIAKAVNYQTKWLVLPVSILQIETSEDVYQFGFNPWAKPFSYFPFESEEKTVRMTYSSFSYAIRLLLIGYIEPPPSPSCRC